MKVYVGNDHLLIVDGLAIEAADGTTATTASATVTAQLKDSDGDAIGSPVSLSYVAASAGRYVGNLEEDVAWVVGEQFVAHIDADAGSDRKAHWEIPLEVLVRTS